MENNNFQIIECPTYQRCHCSSRKDHFRVHSDYKCKNILHSQFPKNQLTHFYIEKKPTWYYSCDVPFDTDEKNVKVLKFFKFLNIECRCQPGRNCDSCLGVTLGRQIFVGRGSFLNLDFLMELEDFVDWDKIVL